MHSPNRVTSKGNRNYGKGCLLVAAKQQVHHNNGLYHTLLYIHISVLYCHNKVFLSQYLHVELFLYETMQSFNAYVELL
jgi:hypothetical protein